MVNFERKFCSWGNKPSVSSNKRLSIITSGFLISDFSSFLIEQKTPSLTRLLNFIDLVYSRHSLSDTNLGASKLCHSGSKIFYDDSLNVKQLNMNFIKFTAYVHPYRKCFYVLNWKLNSHRHFLQIFLCKSILGD